MSLENISDPIVRSYFAGKCANSGGGEREPGYRRAIFFDVSHYDGIPVKVSDNLFTAEDIRLGYLILGMDEDLTGAFMIHEETGILQILDGIVGAGYTNDSGKVSGVLSIESEAAEAMGLEGPGVYLRNTIDVITTVGIVFPA